MTKLEYSTSGVCARSITIELDGAVINSISFEGGCHGNLQGIAALAKGKSAEEVIACCKGIDCKGRGTSCPDQLAIALKEIIG